MISRMQHWTTSACMLEHWAIVAIELRSNVRKDVFVHQTTDTKWRRIFFFVVVVIATHWCYCSYILAFFRPFKCEISNETSDSGKVIAEILHQQQSNVYSPTTTTITNNNKNNNNNGEPKRKHEITIRNHSEEFTRYSNFKSFWPRVS